jgi:hypothetical protein
MLPQVARETGRWGILVDAMPVPSQITPEARHLVELERQLAGLTEQLATKETEFATTASEFARFRSSYVRRFGPLDAELDGLEAEISSRLATVAPTKSARQHVTGAEARTARSQSPPEEPGLGEAAPPTPELKDTFRQLAKSVHPDLAADDAERARRTHVMAAVNEAYSRGDVAALQRILDGEIARPEGVVGDDVASRLVRAIRKLAQVQARFTELVQLQKTQESDPMWELFQRVRGIASSGVDLLASVEAELQANIAAARARLAALDVPARTRPRWP